MKCSVDGCERDAQRNLRYADDVIGPVAGICLTHYNHEYAITHRAEAAARQRAHTARHPKPRGVIRALRAAWVAEHPDLARAERVAQANAWRAANPERARASQRTSDHRRRFNLGKRTGVALKLNPGEWAAILMAYNHRCAYCGKSNTTLAMDHVIPLSKGGPHHQSNIVPACKSCNSQKGTGLPLKPVRLVLL